MEPGISVSAHGIEMGKMMAILLWSFSEIIGTDCCKLTVGLIFQSTFSIAGKFYIPKSYYFHSILVYLITWLSQRDWILGVSLRKLAFFFFFYFFSQPPQSAHNTYFLKIEQDAYQWNSKELSHYNLAKLFLLRYLGLVPPSPFLLPIYTCWEMTLQKQMTNFILFLEKW